MIPSYSVRILVLLTSVGGCNYSSGPPDALTVRDSLGIVIFDYQESLGSLPDAFRIGEVPQLDLGGPRSRPEQELDPRSPFHDAVQLSDGRYVVVDLASLKVFDWQGQFVQTFGGPGQGPGEFGQVLNACIGAGDTIVATHYSDRRVSVFERDGDHVRTFTLADLGVPETGCFSDGSLLVTSVSGMETPDSLTAAFRVSVQDSTARIGSVPPRPRVAFPMTSAGATGIVASGDQFYVGYGDSPEIRVYSAAGELIKIFRWADSVVRFSDDVLADIIRSGRFEMGIPGLSAEELVERIRDQPRLTNLPAYGAMKVDAGGRIWLEDHRYRTTEPVAWTIFDPTGRPLGRVRIPEIAGAQEWIRLGHVGEDHVFLIWRDESEGFVHVTKHLLEPVAPSN